MDDELLFPSDDLARYARRELSPEWLRLRVELLRRRAGQLAADLEALAQEHSLSEATVSEGPPLSERRPILDRRQ